MTGCFFDPAQISRAELRLGFTRKRGSTTARQALFPINVQKRHQYWNMDYPFGVANIDWRDMIDLDESVFKKEHADRRDGVAQSHSCVKEEGPYGRGERINVLLAIAGDDSGERWIVTWTEGGTDLPRFLSFILMIIEDIGLATAQRRRYFIMDNLNTHHNEIIAQVIHAAA